MDGKLYQVIVKQSTFGTIKRSLCSKSIIHSISIHLLSAKTILVKEKFVVQSKNVGRTYT